MPEVEDTEERFTEDERIEEAILARAIGGNQPTVTDLRKALKRHGPVGILESARHLPQAQYDALAEEVKTATPKKRRKMRLGI